MEGQSKHVYDKATLSLYQNDVSIDSVASIPPSTIPNIIALPSSIIYSEMESEAGKSSRRPNVSQSSSFLANAKRDVEAKQTYRIDNLATTTATATAAATATATVTSGPTESTDDPMLDEDEPDDYDYDDSNVNSNDQFRYIAIDFDKLSQRIGASTRRPNGSDVLTTKANLITFASSVTSNGLQPTNFPYHETVSLVEAMRDTKAIENNRTYLWCRFSGSPPPTVTWYKDNRVLRRTNRMQVNDYAGASALCIQKAQPSDTGNYTCSAQQGGLSPVTSTAHLRVLPVNRQVSSDYPRISREAERRTFEIMSSFQIDCPVQSSRSQPVVTWFRNQTPIAVSSESRYSIGNPASDYTLQIRDALETDTGEYECVAWTPLDGYIVVSHIARIYVKARQVSPRITNISSSCEVKSGSNLQVHCVAMGFPMPTVRWEERGRTISNEPPDGSVRTYGSSTAVLVNVRSAKNLTCIANSSLGVVQQTITILVIEEAVAPTSLETIRVDATSIRIGWTPPPRATLPPGSGVQSARLRVYIVRYRKKGAASFIEVDNITQTEYLATPLTPFTEYEFQVLSRNEMGISAPSPLLTAITAEAVPADPPAHIVATAVNRTVIELSWRPPAAPNGLITNYVVSYILVNDSAPSFIAPISHWQRVDVRSPSTRVVLSGLARNRTFRIMLNAQNKAGDGPVSEQILIVTDPSIPQAPRRLTGQTVSATSVSLIWDAPANSWVNISYYEIHYNDSETISRVQSFDMHKVLDGLYPATTYWFRVTAHNQHGRSPPSNTVTLQTEEYMPAASPTNLQVLHAADRYAHLRWDPVAKRDRNGVLTGYRLSYVVNSSFAGWSAREPLRNCTNVTLNAATLSYNLTDLTPWTPYRVWIFALNRRGESPLNTSASIMFTTADSVPGRPTNVNANVVNSTAIRVTWQSPSEGERNGIINGYSILFWEKVDQSSIRTASVSAQETDRNAPSARYDHILSGLRPSTEYEIVVKAITRRGDGERSVAITRRTLAATPDAPTDFVVVASGEPLIVSASWRPPVNTYGPLLRYRLSYVRKERTNGFVSVLASEETRDVPPEQRALWLSSGLFHFGALYEFSLRAMNANGESSAAIARVNIPERRPSAFPSNISVCAVNETSAEVTWDAPPARAQNGVIVLYEVMFARLSPTIDVPYGSDTNPSQADLQMNEVNVNTTERRFVVNQLKEGHEYRFNLRAFNSAGGSDWSDSKLLDFVGTKPAPPRSVFVNRSISDPRTLEIRFTFPAQSISVPIKKFKVYYTKDETAAFPTQWQVREEQPASMIVLNGVDLMAVYSVRLTSVGKDCLESTYSEVARESSARDRLGELRAIFANSTAVRLSWPLVVCADGNDPYTFFTLRYSFRGKRNVGGGRGAELAGREREVNVTSNVAVLSGLKPYSTYDVYLFAPLQPCSVQQPLRLLFHTDVGAPPAPEAPIFHEVVSPNTIALRVKPASNENGIVTHYWIVVVPQLDGRFEPAELICNLTDHDLQVYDRSPDLRRPFLAAWVENSQWPSDNILYVGGDPQLRESKIEKISSLMLHVGLTYRVLLKAFVTSNLFSCSSYSEAFDLGGGSIESPADPSAVASNPGSRIDDLILIISPICAFIALLLIAIIIIVLVMSRRKQARRPYDDAPKNGNTVYLPLQVSTTKRNGDLCSLKQPLLAQQTGSPTNQQAPFVQTTLGSSPLANGLGGSSNSSATGTTMSATNTLHRNGNPLMQPAAVFAAAQNDAHSSPRAGERSYAAHSGIPDPVEVRRLNMPTAALISHPPVPIETFADHVERLKANDNLKFSQEYESIDPGQQFTWEHSNAEVNRSKNRYANVVAYDHSRVTLVNGSSEIGSDYINANYMDGYRKPNSYIATQGPLAETIADFWCMVWQQRSVIIVMMTKLEERTRVKCDQYWPSKGTETYENRMHVTLLDVQEYAYYVIRTLIVQQVGSDEKREVRQLQFTAWPDHGVPEHSAPLLMFIRRVRSYYTADMGPVVVHCSAGVGRTGAFIVIDASLERVRYERTLDIYGHVTCLRAQRNYMVQTEDQYVFIHDALLESLDASLGLTEIAARNLFSHIQKLRQPVLLGGYDAAASASGAGVTTTGMEAEFRRLNMFKPHPSRFVSANATANRFKNRLVNILPYESSRVALQPIRGVEGSDYINASFVDSYRRQRGYVATQGPLAETADDFWRMIWETGSTIVVMLTKLRELGREKCHQYWPADRSTRYQYFVVDPTAEYSMPQYVLREFKMTDARDGSSRTIRQFQYTEWPEQGVPKSGEGFIDFIGQVHKTKEQFGQEGPITVHCSAGVGRTGVFIALSIILERLRYEGVVDVFQIVRMLRTQRPAMVQTEEQYQFCYTAALEYLGSFDHYAT